MILNLHSGPDYCCEIALSQVIRHAALLTGLPQRREWVGWRVTISVSYYGIDGDRPEDLRIRAADVDLRWRMWILPALGAIHTAPRKTARFVVRSARV